MAKSYDVSYLKPITDGPRAGTSVWVTIGRAWQQGEHPDRITLALDALPLPGSWDGRLALYPREA